MNTKSITVTGEGITLATIVWQLLKRQPVGYAETVLAHNPGLADLGPILPVGTVVVFPLEAIPSNEAERPLIRLWD
ncbi:tail protein X [Devosia sp. FJ2-5-3]|uniref:tail protein X n=1 Tax=Devosia sp. FJ2-5-3 TaxID=2976680 RepID=UPI0023D84875|nr:tail protein X [Devosia sp. FJ2-5-3]WEJ60254.1 tail protein X [Devosia sp. FJ2-5-3]